MNTLEFIFYLGIILIVFRFIWWCFSLLLFFIRGGNQKSKFEEYTLKLIAYFITVSISARYINEFSVNGSQYSFYLYSLLTGFILLMYFVRKLQKRQMMAQLSKSFQGMMRATSPNIDPKLEWVVISISMGYFITCLIWPPITDNVVNNWLQSTIRDFYHAPIIGWIVKLMGIFFLLNIIFRGINAITSIIRGKEPQSDFETFSNFNFESHHQRRNDEEFDDYEEVDDNEDENSNRENN